MLGNKFFYFQLIRKYVALFGSVFDNMIIQRTDQEGNLTQQINVPITYVEKEKMLTRMVADPDISRQASVILPRMSFFLDGYTYDGSRMSPRTNYNNLSQVGQTATYQYTPVPWDFHFSLWIYVKNVEDGTKILEQICPFFSPNFTIRAFLIPGGPAVDLPITLREISHEDLDSEQFKDRQTLIWTLHFTLKGWLWGPQITKPTINMANVSFWVGTPEVLPNTANVYSFGLTDHIIDTTSSADESLGGYLTFQPGLDANGNPTSNIADSIPLANINWNDNWGIIELMNGIQYETD